MNAFLIFFAKQKKLALLFTLSVVILGFMTLQKIQRDTYPVIEFDRLSINTSYPSASPRDVEKNITNVIEDKVKGIYGIKELTSTSSEGSSRINIEIEENVDDIQSVKDSIFEAVNEIEDLPEDANDPRVVDRTSTEWPILTIVIGGDNINIETAKAIANNIEKNLLKKGQYKKSNKRTLEFLTRFKTEYKMMNFNIGISYTSYMNITGNEHENGMLNNKILSRK